MVYNKLILPISLFCSLSVNGQTQKELSKISLETSIEKAHHFLIDEQLPSGSFQDSTNALFNVWETILVCDALLDNQSRTDTTILKCIKWLQTNENKDGLICHNEQCKTAYCIETSALYLRLLSRSNPEMDLTSRMKSIANHQEVNGSWKVGNPDVQFQLDFPSVTAFVVNLFDTLHYSYLNPSKAYSFLNSTQNTDGNWGQTWEYYGTAAYAIWQCLPALNGNPESATTLEKAKRWILTTQLPNGSWYFNKDEGNNHISAELQTAFILNSLALEKDMNSLKAFERGIQFLLAQQKENGAWEGGLFPIPNQRYKKREYMITTALAYKSLLVYQQRLKSDD